MCECLSYDDGTMLLCEVCTGMWTDYLNGKCNCSTPDLDIDELLRPDGVTELRLCESDKLILRPDRLYRFTVDPECHACVELAESYDDEPDGVTLGPWVLREPIKRDCPGDDLSTCIYGRIPASQCAECGNLGDYDDPFCSKCQSLNLVQSSAPCPTCIETPEGIEPGKVGVECETCEGQGSVPKTTTPERDKGETFSPCPDCINGLRVEGGNR